MRSEEFAAGAMPPDVHTTMKVVDLHPDSWQSSLSHVKQLQKSIKKNGYSPGEGDEPITVLKHPDGDRLINGNHRVEAMQRLKMWDHQVPVRITHDPTVR